MVNVSAFGAPEFSDLMNVSAKEILAILNAAVLPVLPVLLCCCAAKLCKYQEILKEILRTHLQTQRNSKGNLKDSHVNLKEFSRKSQGFPCKSKGILKEISRIPMQNQRNLK